MTAILYLAHTLFFCSLVLSPLILVYHFLCRVLDRSICSRTIALIWSVLLLRLCLPIPAFVSPITLPDRESAPSIVTSAETETTGPAIPENADIRTPTLNSPAPVLSQTTEQNTRSDKSPQIPRASLSMPDVFALFWLGGVFLSFVLQSARYGIGIRALQRHAYPADDGLTAISHRLCEKWHIRRSVRVMICPALSGPVVCGVLHPVICLPEMAYSNNMAAGIFAHELTHIKRHDLIKKRLWNLAVSLHWYNPLVYLARRDADRFLELACDETILTPVSEAARVQYGEVLLSILQNGIENAPGTPFSPKSGTVRERFTHILSFTAKKRGVVPAVLLCAVILITPLFFGCATQQDNTPGTDNPASETVAPDTETSAQPAAEPYTDVIPLHFTPFVSIELPESLADFTRRDTEVELFGMHGTLEEYYRDEDSLYLYRFVADGKEIASWRGYTYDTDADGDGIHEAIVGNTYAIDGADYDTDKRDWYPFYVLALVNGEIRSSGDIGKLLYDTGELCISVSFRERASSNICTRRNIASDGTYDYVCRMAQLDRTADGGMQITITETAVTHNDNNFRVTDGDWELYYDMNDPLYVHLRNTKSGRMYDYGDYRGTDVTGRDLGYNLSPQSDFGLTVSQDGTYAAILYPSARYDYATPIYQAAVVVDLASGDTLAYPYISDYTRCAAHGVTTDVLSPYQADANGSGSLPQYRCTTTCTATDDGFTFRMTLLTDDGKLRLAGDVTYTFRDGLLSAYTPVETILPEG